jgi:hypothetical protein
MSATVYMPIVIAGETVDVLVAREGDVWRAYATFRGFEIVSRDASMPAALDQWRRLANESANE